MPNPTTFPTLYKLAENGNVIEWHILVDSGGALPTVSAIISTRWGQEGGQFQETRDIIAKGKNVGKKNETSPYEQACAQALSKWEKQQKAKGYCASKEAAMTGEGSDLVEGGVDPMLAFPIEKKPKALKFPCAIQRKYDGHRTLAHVKGGVCTLWSRTRKPINSVPHIQRALEMTFPTGEHWFDGEAYTMSLTFEGLTSILRSAEPKVGHEVVEYHIYDVVTAETYAQRLAWLTKEFACAQQHPLVLAPTVIVQNETEMNALFEAFLEAGYEGAMARNLAGLYVGKRSADLLKLKKFLDAEYQCIGVQYETRTVISGGEQRTVEYPVFTCETPSGKSFNTPMMGELAVVAKLAAAMVGKKLTVKYQDLTADGIPRFPKARLYVAL
jgi:DNA ligase-1